MQDALGDICDECYTLEGVWEKMHKRARYHTDLEMALELGRFRDSVAKIQRLANEALDGEYRS